MFSTGTKRPNVKPRRDIGSPATPLTENRRPASDNSVPNRPSTGTPAPWAPRLSVLARVLPANQNEKGDEIKPVYVGEFPQVVRDEQAGMLQKHAHGDAYVSGGMERGTSLAWIICGNRLFVWSYLSPAASMNCIVLEIPASVFEGGDVGRSGGNSWFLCLVNWDSMSARTKKVVKHCSSAGIILCNKKIQAAVYWPNIYAEGRNDPVFSVASSDELEANTSSIDRKTTPTRQQPISRHRSSLTGPCMFNSLIASAIPGSENVCVALACSSDGELWQFHCSPSGVSRKKVYRDDQILSSPGGENGPNTRSKSYPWSLTWCFPNLSMQESNRKFVLLTDCDIQCFNIELSAEFGLSKIWYHEIIGSGDDVGIKKDLAGKK